MSVKRRSLPATLLVGASLFALASPCRAEDAPLPFGAPAAPAAPSGTAQSGPAAPWLPPAQKAADPAATVSTKEPNLSALRFYAGQNDLARVAAEIRLLRAKFPGWEPPSDLFTETKGGESEQPLWDLFGKHDLDGLKAAIAERQQQTPGWQPSTELATKLRSAEAYDALQRASDAKDYGGVVEIAAANPGLMSCGNVDAIWRTAEALALTDDEAHALDAYRYVLANCTVPQERLATVQKASLVLKSPEAMETLLRLGKRLPNGSNEFAEVRLDGLRQRVGDAAAGKPVAEPSKGDLDQLAARARAPAGGKDAELLGWYALSRKDFGGAETWFRSAMQPNPTPKAAEGLVLALRDGGKMGEAVKLAPQYASLGPLNRKLMVEVLIANLSASKDPVPPDQLTGLAAAIDDERSADAAQAFGWSRFKSGDVAGAEGWFRKSLDWQPSEAAAVGLMIAARQLKQPADYSAVVSRFKATYPRVAELDGVMATASRPARPVREARRGKGRIARQPGTGGWDADATSIVQTFQNGQVDQALAMMENRRAAGKAEPKGLSVVRGWALYKKGDWDGARQVFNDVQRSGLRDEAAKGLNQIELGYTNPRYR